MSQEPQQASGSRRRWRWWSRAREEPLLDPESPTGGFERSVSTRPPSPESQVGWLGFLSFTWFTGIVDTAYKRDQNGEKLEPVHLYQLMDSDRVERHLDRLDVQWAKEQDKPQERRKLWKAMSRAFLCEVLSTGWIKLISDLGYFVNPLMLNGIITFVQDTAENDGKHDNPSLGYIYAAVITVSSAIQAFAMAHYFQKGYRTGMRLRSSLILMVYKKALCVSPWTRPSGAGASAPPAAGAPAPPAAAVQESGRRYFRRRRAAQSGAPATAGGPPAPAGPQVGGMGQVTNLVSADPDKFTFLMPYFNLLWSAPLQLIICFCLLAFYVGWALPAGIATMFIFMWLTSIVQVRMRNFQKQAMEAKDKRLKMQVEMLKIMKIIKLYAWEITIENRVKELRNAEMRIQLKYKLWAMMVFVSFSLSPTCVALATFSTYTVLLGKTLDAATAFTALSIFNILNAPLGLLPMMYGFLIQAGVSSKRIQDFLESKEVAARPGLPRSPTNAVELKAPSISWPDGTPLIGSAVDLEIPVGELLVIVGRTGSGKTGIIYSVLGELSVERGPEPADGYAALRGTVGYCAQNAWIRNCTLRQNITNCFKDEHINTERYEAVLDACAMRADLEVLTDGDQTLIGDRGINLSGGQKQRVALARAVYANPDIYVFDDVLSALDAHVAMHICNNLLKGPLLKGKTVILVTHSRRAIPLADRVLVLQDKTVAFLGAYDDFASMNFMDELPEAAEDKEANTAAESRAAGGGDAGATATVAVAKNGKAGGKGNDGKTGAGGKAKQQEEQRRQGAVGWPVYKAYAKACGGPFPVLLFLIVLALAEGSRNASDLWLAQWTKTASGVSATTGIIVYSIIAGVIFVSGLLYALTRVILGQAGSRRLHESCVHALLRARMTFYDKTPTGQILNRLAEDTNILDMNLPQTMAANMIWIWRSAAIVIICMLVQWYLCALIVPLFIIYGRLARRYLPATRDLRRLDAAARSPIIHHFTETMGGVSTIRAMQQQKGSLDTQIGRLETQMEAYYLSNTAARWLSLRLQFNGTVIVGTVSALGVFFASSGKLDAGIVGLAISYAMKLTDTLNQVNRESADRETQMVSVERCHQLAVDVQQEAALHCPAGSEPPAEWPARGDLKLDHVTMRYRADLPVVLNDLSFEIKGGERVGIVGRTGCGKSSMLLTLMRIVEPETGTMLLDDRDTRQLGLHSLRRCAAIIPQDPAILTGTVRFNLDPFQEKSDQELWDALTKAQLLRRVTEAGGLDSIIEDGGSNYSVGELQLLCLARALLMQKKKGGLLLLDEATSALDAETDRTIQDAIRKEFSCTTITIAHRIRTLMDYDRIIVLNEGSVAEVGSPEELMGNENSQFRSLALQDGVTLSSSSS